MNTNKNSLLYNGFHKTVKKRDIYAIYVVIQEANGFTTSRMKLKMGM